MTKYRIKCHKIAVTRCGQGLCFLTSSAYNRLTSCYHAHIWRWSYRTYIWWWSYHTYSMMVEFIPTYIWQWSHPRSSFVTSCVWVLVEFHYLRTCYSSHFRFAIKTETRYITVTYGWKKRPLNKLSELFTVWYRFWQKSCRLMDNKPNNHLQRPTMTTVVRTWTKDRRRKLQLIKAKW